MHILSRRLFITVPLFVALVPPDARAAELRAKTLASWEKYARATEQRVERDLQQPIAERPPAGQVQITRVQSRDGNGKPLSGEGGMIHHWMGAVFVPGVGLGSVLRFVQDYDNHQKYFQEVEKSRLVSRADITFKIFYRLKRTKVITVVYNTDHTVVYRENGPGRASSRSVATRIAELNDPGTPREKEKAQGDDHGFLWRLNSYWRFEERDGGVIVTCESISLSRGIPPGLGWLIKGFVESVPRESLYNTLASLRDGVKKT